MTESRTNNIRNFLKGRFRLGREDGPRIISTDDAETSGETKSAVATIGIYSHTNAPSFERANPNDTAINVRNQGTTNMTRHVEALLRFPVPVPLQVSYPKSWGEGDFGLMKQFLNESYALFNNSSGVLGTLGAVGDIASNGAKTGVAAILRKLQNVGGIDAQNGFLNTTQTELLFQGIDFREINVSHTFAPESEEELRKNLEMLTIIKKYSSPKFSGNYQMIYPKLFDLDFGVTNGVGTIENIFRTKPCACTNIQVDYTPDQLWNIFKNGHPVKFTMELSFKEVELLTEDDFDVDNPYNSH